MATLEKIRSKSVLLLIVIGVALLAFIIGDFLNSSRTIFGDDNSVASVDGEKIEGAEFQKRQEDLTRNSNATTDEERAYQDQMVLRQMLIERLRDKEFDKLGLTVTDEELNDAVNGKTPMLANYMAMQFTGNPQMTAAQLRSLTNEPGKYGIQETEAQAYKQMWLQFENALSEQLLANKFMSMINGTMTANKLDVAQLYNDQNTGVTINYATVAYTNDPSIKVEDTDIQKIWEADKANYALDEESRLVSMISVPIAPSVEDETAARSRVNALVDSLNTTPDLDALRGQKGFQYQRMTLTNAAIADAVKRGGSSKLKAFADSANVGSAALIEDGPTQFQIAKLFSRASEVDSVTINLVAYETAEATTADSVRAAIAAGKSAKELQEIAGVRVALDSISTSLTNPTLSDELNQLVVGARQAILAAEIGQPFLADTLGNSQVDVLYTVTNRKAPQSNVDIALISYTLEPSATTVNDLRERLEKYITTNNTAAKFYENAAAANYNCGYFDISASTPFVMAGQTQQGPMFLPDSYKAAVWAMGAENGEVSPIFGDERTGSFLVAAVNGIFTDYRTIEDPRVKENLTRQARNEKEAETLVKKFQGKASNVEGYAQAMGSQVQNTIVNLTMPYNNFGSELLGRIMTTPQGVLVGPVKGDNGVVVYQVTTISGPVRKIDMTTDAAAFNNQRGGAVFGNPENFYRLLLGKDKAENRLYKVFRRD